METAYKETSKPSPVSAAATKTVNGSQELKITGYSLSKGVGIGKYISSDKFVVGGHQWAIYFYPDGKKVEDNATYISVFIALESEGTDVRALFELTLVDLSGGEKSQFDEPPECGPYALKNRGSMWGYSRFFKRSELETSGYLKDDCLELRCSVGVVADSGDN